MFLNNYPRLKNKIKFIYFFCCEILFKKDYNIKIENKLRKIHVNNQESFFGYYDKCPLSPNSKWIIFHSFEYSTSRNPNKNTPINIGLLNLESNESRIVDHSRAYNWQQGSRLMWLNEDEFIYNIYCEKDKKYKSRKLNLKTNLFLNFDLPIQDTFKDEFALSLTYERLNYFRPDYGYRAHDCNSKLLSDDLDGVFYLDFNKNDYRLVVSLDALKNSAPKKSMDNANHWLNHIMISPKGDKFMFIHRWSRPGGKRYDRLIVYNFKNNDFEIIADNDMVSHCNWIDNEKIIGYLSGRINEPGYYIIDLTQKTTTVLDELKSFKDGHMSIGQNIMIFDTYPNRNRMKTLNVLDFSSNKVKCIGEFFESVEFFNQTRCDLHPRYDNNTSSIFIDSVHEGKRYLYKIYLNE